MDKGRRGLGSDPCSGAECLHGFSFQEGVWFFFVLFSLSFDGGEMDSVIEEIPVEQSTEEAANLKTCL